MNFIQKMLAKYLGPKMLARFAASTVAFIAALLSAKIPNVAPEAITDFSSGLLEILVGAGGLLIAYFIDTKAAPAKPEIVKED